MYGFTVIDSAAFAWFVACWTGYVWIADHTKWHQHSVSARVNQLRYRWMKNMIGRDPRMLDALIQSGLQQGNAFFASTSILLIGGLLAALSATDQALAVLSELPLAQPLSRTQWEVKVLILIVILGYAFFKFTWCFRLFTYCAILMGAAPLDTKDRPSSERFARHASDLHALAGRHFNAGLRAYFFAIAFLGWLIHPGVFLLSTTWVLYVIWRREFRSRSHKILSRLTDDKISADNRGTSRRRLINGD